MPPGHFAQMLVSFASGHLAASCVVAAAGHCETGSEQSPYAEHGDVAVDTCDVGPASVQLAAALYMDCCYEEVLAAGVAAKAEGADSQFDSALQSMAENYNANPPALNLSLQSCYWM